MNFRIFKTISKSQNYGLMDLESVKSVIHPDPLVLSIKGELLSEIKEKLTINLRSGKREKEEKLI